MEGPGVDRAGIDAVLALTLQDYERFEILRTSLRRFFADLRTCWVVTPDSDYDRLRSLIRETPYQVICDSAVVPELRFYNLVRKTPGWQVQQLIKMGIADRIDTPFYLTLDADVICTRPVRSTDLIADGRAISDRYRAEIHHQWYRCAERILGLPRSGWIHGVTPALFSKEAMTLLQEYLSRRVHPALRSAAALLPGRSATRAILASWRSFLLRNVPWTEYALYNTFLEAKGLYDRYHVTLYRVRQDGYVLEGNSVWAADEWRTWQPEKSFGHTARFFFSVVQSNTGVTAADVWAKVRPFLG